jgi:hypothetical protein
MMAERIVPHSRGSDDHAARSAASLSFFKQADHVAYWISRHSAALWNLVAIGLSGLCKPPTLQIYGFTA